MTRREGLVSRFFFNPVTNTAMFRMRGEDQAYHVTVNAHMADFDDFVMTRPGDKVAVEIDSDDVLDAWFNETFLTKSD